MNHHIIILCGKSACGKGLIESKLVKNGYKRVVTNTTRPPREKEKEGVDYYFRTKDEFFNLISDGQMIEYRSYNTAFGTWYYGSSADNIDLDNHDYVITLTLDGAESFLKYFGEEKCIVFYIDAPKAVREQRAKDRDPKGFSQDEWDRRVKADNVDFAYDKICRICDFKVDNYNKTIYNLIKEIKDDIRLWING